MFGIVIDRQMIEWSEKTSVRRGHWEKGAEGMRHMDTRWGKSTPDRGNSGCTRPATEGTSQEGPGGSAVTAGLGCRSSRRV